MGKKKRKPFIDKKNSYTFQLVHRSQQDPLIASDEASQHVLRPLNEPALEAQRLALEETDDGGPVEQLSEQERKKEQVKYSVFFDDDYDYLQHLRERRERVEWVAMPPGPLGKQPNLKLPPEVFPSVEEEEVGLLNKAAPLVGPQLDWDPDIVAAMDDDFDYSDPSNELEDDFVLQANDGEVVTAQPAVYIEQEEEEEEEVEEEEEEEEEKDEEGKGKRGNSCGDVPSEDGSCGAPSDSVSSRDGLKSQFTEYSLSSSAVPRNEGLTLLDHRFEKFMDEYDCELIGALNDLELEEDEMELTGNDKRLLDVAVADFEQNYKASHEQPELGGTFPHEDEGECSDTDSDLSMEQVAVQSKPQWDCESVLSTYSNLYNHPARITEPPSLKGERTEKRQVPTSDNGGSISSELVNPPASHVRLKGESLEGKKARKQLVKQERKVRREVKKRTKTAYKQEQLRVAKQILHAPATSNVV